MQKPAIPANEAERLRALHDLLLLDTPAEEVYDRITRLAQRLFDVPIALVSLIDADRQWFKSRQGLAAEQTPRDVSFCGHAILGSEVFLVPDALADPRFADNPLVTGAPNVRFYAGAPLSVDAGLRVGTLCLIDHQKRSLSEEQLQTLRDLAEWANATLASGRKQAAARLLIEHESFLQAVLDTVLDAVVTIDEVGCIRSFNRSAELMFGYEASEVLGSNVKRLMPPPYLDAHDGYLKRFREHGEARIIGIGREVEGLRKNGERFAMHLAVGEMAQSEQRHFVGIVKDISRRKLAEQKLDEANRWRQAILDCASVAIIATDTEGVIQTFNRAAERMLGYQESEIVGRQTPGVFHDPDEVVARAKAWSQQLGRKIEPGFETFIARARDGTADEHEWTYVRKDGERLTVCLAITALTNSAGMVTGYLGIASDISERKKVERLKSEFVATVSHELRTPLTSIRGALGAVLGKSSVQLADPVRRLLETANRNSERLTVLINDILDLEKIEAGNMSFDMTMVDLGALCENALAANDGYARLHGVELQLSKPVSPALTLADSHRLMQVLGNLLSNAIKYSPVNGKVELMLVDDACGNWQISVRDYGAGIPEAFRASIFQRFAQADASDSKARGGTGLGLSIAKAIVERHSGQLHYSSEVGIGTTFRVDLPQFSSLDPTARNENGPRVLICEDNADVAFVLAELVRQDGFACDTSGSAAAARVLLAERRYALLLLDLKLPDSTGLAFIDELRQMESTREMPILVISGRADEGRSSWAGESLSVVDWLQKPVDRERLASALHAALRGSERPRILHVDEDLDVIQVTRALTEGLADLDFAQSLAEARGKLAESQYDLLIVDANLPGGSGLELLAQLPPECRVLVYTGDALDGEGLTTQVAAVLTKGQISSEQLLQTVRQLLANQRP